MYKFGIYTQIRFSKLQDLLFTSGNFILYIIYIFEFLLGKAITVYKYLKKKNQNNGTTIIKASKQLVPKEQKQAISSINTLDLFCIKRVKFTTKLL